MPLTYSYGDKLVRMTLIRRHVAQLGKTRHTYKMLVRNPLYKKVFGRPTGG